MIPRTTSGVLRRLHVFIIIVHDMWRLPLSVQKALPCNPRAADLGWKRTNRSITSCMCLLGLLLFFHISSCNVYGLDPRAECLVFAGMFVFNLDIITPHFGLVGTTTTRKVSIGNLAYSSNHFCLQAESPNRSLLVGLHCILIIMMCHPGRKVAI